MAPARALHVALTVATLWLSARPAAADFESAKKFFLDNAKNADWKARRNAYLALGDHDGAPSVALVLGGIAAEGNAAVSAGAVDVLSAMRSAPARQALVDAVRKGKGPERLLALVALGSQRAPEVDALLVEVVSTGAPPLAAQAAWGLGMPGRAGAGPALVKALAHDSPQVRFAAAHALGSFGERETVKPLVDRLKVEKGRARHAVVVALEALTGKRLGDAPARWVALADGKDPATVDEKPALPPTFFGVPVTGDRVAFVLDRSLLMADPHPFTGPEHRARLEEICTPPEGGRIPYRTLKSKMQLATAHILHACDGLPVGTRIEVVTFCKEVKGVFGLKWAPMGAATKKVLEDALKDPAVDDGIDLWDGLEAALDLGGPGIDKGFRGGPEEVLLVTNNMPTAGPVKDADGVAAGIALEARLRLATVSVVGIGNHPFALAETLAKRTGGTYVNLSK